MSKFRQFNLAAILAAAISSASVAPTCAQDAAMRVRVGVPLVARGPAPNIADNWFTEIQLPGGKFRGFTAGATTFAIDGNQPYDMDM
jgi:hypothetical protein